MATRAELKRRAKDSLRFYYWWAVLACFLVGLLGGASDESGGINLGGVKSAVVSQLRNLSGEISDVGGLMVLLSFAAAFFVGIVIALIFGTFWKFLVGNPVRVGSCAFFLESREQQRSAGIGKLFWAFENGRYKNVAVVMFMRWLYTFLWSLLFLIPGIIKGYEYYLVPYILYDTPDIDYKAALRLSRDMMYGNKWRLFVLQLSFIGWNLLAALCCGIGLFFLTPYLEATYLEFYEDVRRQYYGSYHKNSESFVY